MTMSGILGGDHGAGASTLAQKVQVGLSAVPELKEPPGNFVGVAATYPKQGQLLAFKSGGLSEAEIQRVVAEAARRNSARVAATEINAISKFLLPLGKAGLKLGGVLMVPLLEGILAEGAGHHQDDYKAGWRAMANQPGSAPAHLNDWVKSAEASGDSQRARTLQFLYQQFMQGMTQFKAGNRAGLDQATGALRVWWEGSAGQLTREGIKLITQIVMGYAAKVSSSPPVAPPSKSPQPPLETQPPSNKVTLPSSTASAKSGLSAAEIQRAKARGTASAHAFRAPREAKALQEAADAIAQTDRKMVELIKLFQATQSGGKAAAPRLAGIVDQVQALQIRLTVQVAALTAKNGRIDSFLQSFNPLDALVKQYGFSLEEVGLPGQKGADWWKYMGKLSQEMPALAQRFNQSFLPQIQQFIQKANAMVRGLDATKQLDQPKVPQPVTNVTKPDQPKNGDSDSDGDATDATPPAGRGGPPKKTNGGGTAGATPPSGGDGRPGRPTGGNDGVPPRPSGLIGTLGKNAFIGAAAMATMKGLAYCIKHRDKSLQDLAKDPGLRTAILMGALEGAVAGTAWTGRAAGITLTGSAVPLTHAQIAKIVRTDFIYGGGAAATIAGIMNVLGSEKVRLDTVLKDPLTAVKAMREYFSKPQNTSNFAINFVANFMDAGTDVMVLGLLPGSVVPLGPYQKTLGFIKTPGIGITRFALTNPTRNYVTTVLSQSAFRAALGGTVEFGNQAISHQGDIRQTNQQRLLWAALGGAAYPLVMQTFQGLAIRLANVFPPARNLTDISTTRVPVNGGEKVTRVVTSKITDTQQPWLAYGGRAILYGAFIGALKRNVDLAGAAGAPTILDKSAEDVAELLRDPEALRSLIQSPEFQDTLKRINALPEIEKAMLLSGYIPSDEAAKKLAEMKKIGVDMNLLFVDIPVPQRPQNLTEWGDKAKVEKYHRQLDVMINTAYARWRGKP